MSRDEKKLPFLYDFDHVSNIVVRAVNTYGDRAQMDMMIEEMSELTKAICKFRRADTNITRDAVLEEMADVQIMLYQMALIFGDPNPWIDAKLHRLEDRLNNRESQSCTTSE